MTDDAETIRALTERLRRQSGPYPPVLTVTEEDLLRGYARDDEALEILRELGVAP